MTTNTEHGHGRVAIGQIVGVFGIKGWLKVRSDAETPITEFSPWYLATPHGLKIFEVDDYLERPQGLIVHLQGVDDRDAAASIGKARIEVEKALLPDLGSDEYYWHQLIGLRVVTVFSGVKSDLGCVERLIETGANDVLVVKGDEHSADQLERLIPYIPEMYVLEVNVALRQITVDWDPQF